MIDNNKVKLIVYKYVPTIKSLNKMFLAVISDVIVIFSFIFFIFIINEIFTKYFSIIYIKKMKPNKISCNFTNM